MVVLSGRFQIKNAAVARAFGCFFKISILYIRVGSKRPLIHSGRAIYIALPECIRGRLEPTRMYKMLILKKQPKARATAAFFIWNLPESTTI